MFWLIDWLIEYQNQAMEEVNRINKNWIVCNSSVVVVVWITLAAAAVVISIITILSIESHAELNACLACALNV